MYKYKESVFHLTIYCWFIKRRINLANKLLPKKKSGPAIAAIRLVLRFINEINALILAVVLLIFSAAPASAQIVPAILIFVLAFSGSTQF